MIQVTTQLHQNNQKASEMRCRYTYVLHPGTISHMISLTTVIPPVRNKRKLDTAFAALPVQEPQSLPKFHTLPDTSKTGLKRPKIFCSTFSVRGRNAFLKRLFLQTITQM